MANPERKLNGSWKRTLRNGKKKRNLINRKTEGGGNNRNEAVWRELYPDPATAGQP
jgi:hypothetical protein